MNYNDPERVPPTWKVGDVILDRYEVKQVFTGGGMGLVYRVHHGDWDMDLAAKAPRPEFFQSQQQIENFEREAETWVTLGLHPHIVSCYYVRRLGGVPRIFAEYVEGGTLADWIRTKKLYEGGKEKALERIIDIAIQFAWGLQYAHEKGLVHQDVKPGNVLLSLDGTTKVSDFGLANARRASAESTAVAGRAGQSILVPGSGFMTPEYASPEQLRGEALSRKTDIWSWAVSLFEMLLGELTWASGLAAPSVIEDLDEGSIDPELIDLLDRCFGSRSHPRWVSFDPVVETLAAYYTSHFGIYPRSAPQAVALLANSLNNRGASLLDLGELEAALMTFEKALEVNPTQPEAHYNRGRALWRSGRITDVDFIRRLEELRQTHPDEWRVAYYLGLVQMERNNIAEAISTLESVAECGGGSDVRNALREAHSFKSADVTRSVRIFEGHNKTVSSICLSADGGLALSGSWDNTLRLWDAATGECMRVFAQHTDAVTAVSLSADSRRALSGSLDKTLKVWDLATGECLLTLESPSPIHCVCLSSGGRWALSGGGASLPSRTGGWGGDDGEKVDCTVRVWDLESGKCVQVIEGHRHLVRCVCLTTPQRWALSGSDDGTLRVWDKTPRTLKGHRGGVIAVCLTSDHQLVLSGGRDGTIRLWNIATGECVRIFDGGGGFLDGINAISLSSNDKWAVSASGYLKGLRVQWEHRLRLWDIASGQCLRSIECDSSLYSVCLSRDRSWAFAGGFDGKLRLWDLRAFTQAKPRHFSFALCRVADAAEAVKAARQFAFHIGMGEAAVAKGDWKAALRETRVARSLPGYSIDASAMALWNTLASHCARPRLADVWKVGMFGSTSAALSCVSPDGTRAMFLNEDNVISIWDTATGEFVDDFYGPSAEYFRVVEMRISSNNRFALLGGGYDREDHDNCSITWVEPMLHLWNIESGEKEQTLWSHQYNTNERRVVSVFFSPDDRLACAVRNDGVVRLWDVATRRCLREFPSETEASQDPEICWAMSGGLDSGVRFCALARRDPTLVGERIAKRGIGHLTQDNCFALIEKGGGLELWALDWDLEARELSDWDEGARPELQHFLSTRIPYAADLPKDRKPSDEEIDLVLTRKGKPVWSEEDVQKLLTTLGYAGYGWVSPDAVRHELETMATQLQIA